MESSVTAFCLLVCQMCGKGTFSQIRSHMLTSFRAGDFQEVE